MEGKKVYYQPYGRVLDAINDIVELQKGKLTFSDTPHGKIHFLIKMYAFKWELQFAVTDLGNNRSNVILVVGGEKRGKEDVMLREFALLDSMLMSGSQIEITKKDDG